ncbi:hypothetical protein X975_13321, partial [Stegodyphus mimosarum]
MQIKSMSTWKNTTKSCYFALQISLILIILIPFTCPQAVRNTMVLNNNPSSFNSALLYSQMNMNNFPGQSSMTQMFGSGSRRLSVLSTLFNGLRNSGLEQTIAGEVLQRLIKTTLKDILVPFKSNAFSSGSV